MAALYDMGRCFFVRGAKRNASSQDLSWDSVNLAYDISYAPCLSLSPNKSVSDGTYLSTPLGRLELYPGYGDKFSSIHIYRILPSLDLASELIIEPAYFQGYHLEPRWPMGR